MRRLFLILTICFVASCAREREVIRVPADARRIPKAELQGLFYFLKSVEEVKAVTQATHLLAPGMPILSDKLVRFVIRESQVDVESVQPNIAGGDNEPRATLLASFPVRHVDVLRRTNESGDPTHEEEVTDGRKAWQARDFVIIDWEKDSAEAWDKEEKLSATVRTHSNSSRTYFDVSVEKLLEDESLFEVKYSFLRAAETPTSAPIELPQRDRKRIGFFTQTQIQLNPSDEATRSLERLLIQHWDAKKDIRFYFGPSFPDALKSWARHVFEKWDAALFAATGRHSLTLHENSGQVRGDLRFNMLEYVQSNNCSHGLLALGPVFVDPRNATIQKADVFFYHCPLARAGLREEALKEDFSKPHPSGGDVTDHPQAEWLSQARFHKFSTWAKDILPSMASLLSGSDPETLRATLFKNLLAHELGHTLGLSHNFRGSSDGRHWILPAKTASAMDYPFLRNEGLEGPGLYDVAALKYLHGDTAERQRFLDQHFEFCSDDDLGKIGDPYCHAHDQGQYLDDILASLATRYQANLGDLHERRNRLYFPLSDAEMRLRLTDLLFPIRKIWLSTASENGEKDERISQVALGHLTNIVKSTAHSEKDIVSNDPPEVSTSGVLIDKEIALRLLVSPFTRPNREVVRPLLWDATQGDVLRVFGDVFSNTEQEKDVTGAVFYRTHSLGISDALRWKAVEIFSKEIRSATPYQLLHRFFLLREETLDIGELRRVAAAPAGTLSPAGLFQPERWKACLAQERVREKVRQSFLRFWDEMASRPEHNSRPRETSRYKNLLVDAHRAFDFELTSPGVYCALASSSQYLGSEYFIMGQETIVGRMIRDQINVLEDEILALDRLILSTRTDIDTAAGANVLEVANLLQRSEYLDEKRQSLQKELNQDLAIITRLARLFEGN